MTTFFPSREKLRLSPGFIAWLAFISLCLLIGLAAAFEVFTKGLVLTNLTDKIPWGLWITIDLSAIGLGAGAFTLSAIVYLFGIKRFKPIIRLAVFVGFIGYSSALLTLVADIGRPDRFWHPWFYWNVHSVLWEITWCITIYLTILLVEIAPVIAENPFFDRWSWVREVAGLIHKGAPILALLGLGVSLLHQSSLGATYGILKSRPLWFKPSMPIMFIISAVAVGPAVTMALAFVLEWVTGKKNVPHRTLKSIARFSGFGLLAYTYIKFWDLAAVTYYGRTPAVNQALFTLNETTPYGFGFWFGEIILGILIPVLLFLIPRFNRNPVNLVVGAIFAMTGIFFNRWNVTVTGLTVSMDFSPGTIFQIPPSAYTPNLAEWGIAIGVAGYVLLMVTLGVKFLPLFTPREH